MSWGAALAGIGQGLPQGIRDFQGLDQSYQSGLDQASTTAAGTSLQLLQALMMHPPQPPQMGPGGMPQAGTSPMSQGGQSMGGQPQQNSGMALPMAPPSGPPGSFAGRFPAATPPPMEASDPSRQGGYAALQATMPDRDMPQGGPGMGAMAQMQPQGQPQGQGQQQQGGPLTWQTIIQAVQRANPGAPPAVLFGAVNKMLPLMNSQSMMEWRQIQAQNAGQRVGQGWARVDQGDAKIAQGDRRLDQGDTAEARKASQGEEKKREFDIREARITAHQMVTTDQAWQRLDQQRKALQARVQQGGEKQKLAEWRAVLDAQHKRAQEIIGAWSQQNTMPPETRKQLLKDADEGYNAAIKDIGKGDKGTFDQRFQGAGQQSPP